MIHCPSTLTEWELLDSLFEDPALDQVFVGKRSRITANSRYFWTVPAAQDGIGVLDHSANSNRT